MMRGLIQGCMMSSGKTAALLRNVVMGLLLVVLVGGRQVVVAQSSGVGCGDERAGLAMDKQVRVPDNEDILARTIDSSSPYYLSRLLSRYLAGGEGLTDEEYHYLYYGYAYSQEYRPLDAIEAEDKLLGVVEKIMSEPTEENMQQIIDYGLQVMERDPFSPKNLNFLAFAYGSIGDTINERRCFERMNKVLDTIERSGSGAKESSPMHVLAFSHASDLLYARGLDIKRREVVSRTAEFIFLPTKDKNGLQGYYFDFSRIYWTKPSEEKTPEKRGWTLNNVPIN